MGSLKTMLTATICSSLYASLALAADLDPPQLEAPAINEQMVEFGTGWYIRGDVAFTKDSMPKISSDLNLINGISTKSGWDAGIGGGYKFNNWFRADATFDYLRARKANGLGGSIQCPDRYGQTDPINNPLGPVVLLNQACGVTQATRLHHWAALANGYLDLGSWYGISPYLGAGVGFSYNNKTGAVNYLNPDGSSYSRTLTDPNTFPGVTTTYQYDQTVRAKQYQLAWALMAGVSVDIASHTSLDVGYRYLNLGDSKGVRAKDGTVYSKAMTEQQLRVGIRYMID